MQSHWHPVKVTYFDSFERFSVQLMKNVRGVRRLSDEVVNFVSSIGERRVFRWKNGDHCLVLVPTSRAKEKNRWLRGLIESIDGKVSLYLRDYGYSVAIDKTNGFLPIPAHFIMIQDGAIKCKLLGAGDDRPNPEAEQKLMRTICKNFDQLAITAHGGCEKNVLLVTLWGIPRSTAAFGGFGWTNISKIIKENGVAASSAVVKAQKPNVPQDCSEKVKLENAFIGIDFVSKINHREIGLHFDQRERDADKKYDIVAKEGVVVDWLPSEPIVMQNFAASVTYVDKKCVIYVLEEERLVTAEIMSKKITEYVKKTYGSAAQTFEFAKGQPCFSMFADGQFYRGKLKRILPSEKCCIVSAGATFSDSTSIELMILIAGALRGLRKLRENPYERRPSGQSVWRCPGFE